jgi:glycyl-tRNA synthetase (class II)
LSLHHSLSPFKVAIMVDGKSARSTELRELQQLFTQQLNQSRISVLPSGASWTIGQCDSRAIPFVILVDETTLEKGICRLRNRDTSIEVMFQFPNVGIFFLQDSKFDEITLQVEIHVSEVIEHMRSICRK